ncbi:hypothetical protein BGW41_002360 [Actinomortierella wolfii]|nr:hypothetical protein BGW41_002360 [Actinomortierella wolfii]
MSIEAAAYAALILADEGIEITVSQRQQAHPATATPVDALTGAMLPDGWILTTDGYQLSGYRDFTKKIDIKVHANNLGNPAHDSRTVTTMGLSSSEQRNRSSGSIQQKLLQLLTSGCRHLFSVDRNQRVADKLQTLLKAANIELESIMTALFAKALEGKNVAEMLTNVGAAGAAPAAGAAAPAGGAAAAEEKAEEKKEEAKEESDEDMGFGLFD